MGLAPEVNSQLVVKHTFLEYDDKAPSDSTTPSSLTRPRCQTEPSILTNVSFGDVPQNVQESEASSSSSHQGDFGEPWSLQAMRPDYDASRSSIVTATPDFTPMHFPMSRHAQELLQTDWPENLLPDAWYGAEAMSGYCQWNDQYGQYGWWAPDQFAAGQVFTDEHCKLGYGQYQAGSSILNQVSVSTPISSDRTSAPSIKQEVPKASISTTTGAAKETRTTVMLRDLPEAYSRSLLLKLLEAQGFFGRFDFVYLPVDFKHQKNLGYALINLVSPSEALRLTSHFDGFSNWDKDMLTEQVCTVGWCSPQQGLDAHVERYRNSPVMHESVPEEWRPMLLSHGVAIPFPEPTIKIKAPKVKGRQS